MARVWAALALVLGLVLSVVGLGHLGSGPTATSRSRATAPVVSCPPFARSPGRGPAGPAATDVTATTHSATSRTSRTAHAAPHAAKPARSGSGPLPAIATGAGCGDPIGPAATRAQQAAAPVSGIPAGEINGSRAPPVAASA